MAPPAVAVGEERAAPKGRLQISSSRGGSRRAAESARGGGGGTGRREEETGVGGRLP
jgi:hypothetical protein